jgi:hypothetical protein
VQPAQLVHHDYEPWHLFADAADTRSGAQPGAAHITGVIDLESCRGGDPAYDLAQWHVIHDAYAPVAPVIEGYRVAGGWSSGFGERLHLSLVHFRLLELLDRLKGRGQPLADDVDTAKRAQRLLAETVQKVVNQPVGRSAGGARSAPRARRRTVEALGFPVAQELEGPIEIAVMEPAARCAARAAAISITVRRQECALACGPTRWTDTAYGMEACSDDVVRDVVARHRRSVTSSGGVRRCRRRLRQPA